MSRTHKWPAKALNMLVALAMVISLCVVFAPAVAADTPDEIDCDPVEQFVGCNMEVFVNTYTKDDVTGDFTPDSQFDYCDYFYVNAVVVNTGNETMVGGNITANLNLPSDVGLVTCADNDEEQTKEVDPVTLGGVEMVDFWWKVHCDAAGGLATIEVEVSSDLNCPEPVYGYTYVTQREPDECVIIEIIEAPGMPEKVGAPQSPFGQTVVPCTNFGIKARITNDCLTPLTNVNGTIRWGEDYNPYTDSFANEDTAPDGDFASIVGGDPLEWCVGDLNPGDSAIVGWTLHCDAPGDIEILVQAEDHGCADGTADETLHPWTDYIDNPWTVYQQEETGLLVEILQPGECEEVLTYSDNCPDNVDVVVRTTNNSADTLQDVITSVDSANGTEVWTWVGSKYDIVGILIPGQSALSYFTGRCMGVGMVELEADAEGKVVVTLESVVADPDTVRFLQNAVTATMPATAASPYYPLYTRPSTVNVCDTFEVVGSFWNNTGVNLTTATVCIYWKGNATLLGMQHPDTDDNVFEPRYDRCLVPGVGWQYFVSPNRTVNGPDAQGYYWNCQTVAICDCCETRVKWTFMCLEDEDIEFYTKITAVVGSDTFEDNSLSPHPLDPEYPDCALYPVIVHQEYKAHLIVGLFTFLQNDCGAMLQRDAFAPCQNFHVVIPVVNVGEEAALNVVVNFAVTGTDTWDVDEIATPVTGDVDDWDFNSETGVGWAKFNTIYGNSMEKLILQLHCKDEGRVNILIPPGTGVQGVHANTGAAIDITNLEWPDCPIGVDQVPFSVELVNPIECETFNPGDRFTVKARLHNDGDTALDGVSATLHWTGNAQVEPPQVSSSSGGVWSSTKTIGNSTDDTLSAHSYAEVTWVMECTNPGEVYLWVTATADEPYLTTESEETVNIHQAYKPDICVTLLSPKDDDTPIATSQEFAVTAVVRSVGGLPATGVTAAIYDQDEITANADGVQVMWELDEGCITPGTETIYVNGVAQVRDVDYTIDYIGMMTGKATITFTVAPPSGAAIWATFLPMHTIVAAAIDGVDVEPATQVLVLGDMAPNTFKIVTWTVHADTTCRATCSYQVDVELGVGVNATNLVPGLDGDYDYAYVCVDLYTAAHLVADIDYEAIPTTISMCDEFVVPYRVYNTGKADAWEVTATLSVVPEGSVRIAAGDEGYTQYIGTLVGWGTNDYYEGEFTLHCKEACETTITITPAGRDECGYYALIILGEVGGTFPGHGDDDGFWDDTWDNDYDDDWYPGIRIPDWFLEPDSVTVKQLESGGLDLAISKTVDDAYPEIEQVVTFTIMVTNYGPTDASGVEVTDIEPAGLTFGTPVATQGTYSAGVWDVGSLAAGLVYGASATLQIPATVDSTDEITNTATITAVDQPDGYPFNDSASVTLNEAAVTSVPIGLDADWNLVSLPLIPTDSAIAVVMAGVDVDIVWAYDAAAEAAVPGTGWTSWDPVFLGDLTEMRDGKGYWVDMNTADTLTVSGVELPLPPSTPPTYGVVVGWNLIGFKSTTARTAGDYLAAIAGDWTRIYGYANGVFFVVQSGDSMQPGFGYWLAATDAGTIYP